MSSPIYPDIFHCEDTTYTKSQSYFTFTEDGLNDSLDGFPKIVDYLLIICTSFHHAESKRFVSNSTLGFRSSAELTDVFEEDGCEVEAWTPPPSELRRKIIAQLEHYFSDENLETDAFLLKHVQRNKMGYVSLKLLTSFKKIKDLTRDWRTTLAAACSSEHLEVNDSGTKVRRKTPIPDRLLCIPTSKLLLAWNFLGNLDSTALEDRGSPAADQQSIMETAMSMFSSHGTITSLRILRPGKEIPAELKRYTRKHPELGRKLCAVVEFEYLEGARKAFEALNMEEQVPEGKGIRVALLGSRGTRKQENSLGHVEEDLEEGIENECSKKFNQKTKKHLFSLEDSAMYSASESDFAPASPRPNRRVSRPQSLYGSPLAIPRVSSFRTDPYRNPLGSPVGSPLQPRRLFSGAYATSPLATPPLCSTPTLVCNLEYNKSKSSVDFSQESTGYGESPWVQRRKNAARAFQPEKSCLESPNKVKACGVLVMRQPLGPDGTKGFHNCIGRGQVLLPQ